MITLGPPPTEETFADLVTGRRGIQVFLDMRDEPNDPDKRDRTKELIDSSNQSVTYVRSPFVYQVSRTDTDELRIASKATAIIGYAKSINEKLRKGARIYIFARTGNQVEVFIGMALWHLRRSTHGSGEKPPKPGDLDQWIIDREFTYWFDNSEHERDVLERMWREISKDQEGLLQFFRPVKRPKQ